MGTQHLTVTSTTGFCELFHEFELCSDEILALLQNLDDDNNSNLFSVADTPGPIMMNKKRTSNKSKKRKKPAQSTSSYSLRLCSDEESDEGHAVLSRRKNVKRQKASLSPPTTCMESRSGEDSGGVGESNTNNNGNVVSHIAVERNRRKQMNEHLAVLRQLMPCFYVKKGDQASIVGGVIDYIDELHHVLQSLEAKKRRKIYSSEVGQSQTPKVSNMMMSSQSNNNNSVANELVVRSNSDLADVEVKFRGPNLELTTLYSKIAGQTCKIVSAIEDLSLEILQLSVNAVEEAMLNTFIIKIGIDCQLSAEELAQQIQQTFC